MKLAIFSSTVFLSGLTIANFWVSGLGVILMLISYHVEDE